MLTNVTAYAYTTARWTYTFTYRMPCHTQRYAVRGEISFNVGARAPTDVTALVKFTITEDDIKKENPDQAEVTALRVTVKLGEMLPLRVGIPLLKIANYTCERIETVDPRTLVYFYKDDRGYYLRASEATGTDRTFVLPDMDILERQNAQTEIGCIDESENVDGHSSDRPNTDITPKVSFPSPTYPFLSIDDPINLTTWFSSDEHTSGTDRLKSQLIRFFETLFANAHANDVIFGLTVSYQQPVSMSSGDPIRIEPLLLPILLIPKIQIALPFTGSAHQFDSLMASLMEGVENWSLNAGLAPTDVKTLVFNLIVYSSLADQPLPLMNLTIYTDD